jgi:hypothetical protein
MNYSIVQVVRRSVTIVTDVMFAALILLVLCNEFIFKSSAIAGDGSPDRIELIAGDGSPDSVKPVAKGDGSPDSVKPVAKGDGSPDSVKPVAKGDGSPDSWNGTLA